jgi:hypothetical protein
MIPRNDIYVVLFAHLGSWFMMSVDFEGMIDTDRLESMYAAVRSLLAHLLFLS